VAARLVSRGEPLRVGAPGDVLRKRPEVGTTTAESEGLEPNITMAPLPARIIRSAHELAMPQVCLTRHYTRRALSSLRLSGQLFKDTKR
jgi:hypothetical protein